MCVCVHVYVRLCVRACVCACMRACNSTFGCTCVFMYSVFGGECFSNIVYSIIFIPHNFVNINTNLFIFMARS